MDRINIACCGGWHPHARHFAKDRAQSFCADLPYNMAVIWDDNPVRGQEWADDMGAVFEPDYDKVVTNPNIDAVIITAQTMYHKEMILKAVRNGKHVYCEKPLAPTAADAMEIRDAIKENKVHFTISDPPARFPVILYARDIIESGRLGQVTSVRCRMGHNEAWQGVTPDSFYDMNQSGGGAMLDMGHHSVHSILLLLGVPRRVMAFLEPMTERGKANGIDENSIAIMEYDGGILGTAETGWVQPGGQRCLDVFFTGGSILLRNNEVTISEGTGRETETRMVTEEELDKYKETYPLRYWMENILNDRIEERYDIDLACRGAALEEAMYTSWKTGKACEVKET